MCLLLLAPVFAARAPEAIWVAWPENPDGGSLAPATRQEILARLKRADAVLAGPGLGRNPRSLSLVADLVKLAKVPVLLDADALQPEIIQGAKAPLVLTPHAGEFERIAGKAALRDYCADTGATVILKGPLTRACCGTPPPARGGLAVSSTTLTGGPVLARGGSGDLLSGLTGGLIAANPRRQAPCGSPRGATRHGAAADRLAWDRGQTSAVVERSSLPFRGPSRSCYNAGHGGIPSS